MILLFKQNKFAKYDKMIRGYLVHLSVRTSLEAFYNQKWYLNILAWKTWDSVSTHFAVFCALQSTGYF